MEILATQQEMILNILKIIIFLGCLILVMISAFYNVIYLMKILNSNSQIGLNPPKHIGRLLKTSISLSIITALFILFFLITGIY